MTKEELKKEIQESIDYAQTIVDSEGNIESNFECEEAAQAHIDALEWILKELDTLV